MLSFFKKKIAEFKGGAVDWDEVEALLIQSDLGLELTETIMEKLKGQALSAETVYEQTQKEITALWSEQTPFLNSQNVGKESMQIWLIVGVNGVGKTTTISKLAARYHSESCPVHLVAADTFRAAAIEQLGVWADRLGVSITKGKEGGDPAAAAYEGVEEAKEKGAKLVLIDTAGRLHNKNNLMRELEKVKRVVGKNIEGAPHQTLLVIDGTNGANSVEQAAQFHSFLEVTGLVVTKMDSSSKGGAVAAIKAEHNIDTLLVGSGESVEDLEDFDAQKYVENFF